jgi:hypothetical protein
VCSSGSDAASPLDASTASDGSGDASTALDGSGDAFVIPDASLDASMTPDAFSQAPPDSAPGTEAGVLCGPGSYASGGGCVPVSVVDAGLGYYDVRVAVTTVPGDGMTMVPILALGRLADGSASTEQVVFSLSRPGSGTITPSTQLTPTGATVYFVPCNAATSSACTGPVQVLMALASAPSTPVATSPEITISSQPAVGTPSACLGGGNIAYIAGDPGDYITGGNTYTYQAPNVTMSLPSPTHATGQLGSFGDYMVDFSTDMLGMPLMLTTYENAERWPFEDVDHAGFSLEGMGAGCNTLTARFQIERLNTDASGLLEFLATFEQHCEGATPAARGCVYWHR